jgi:hypothetical protein
VKVEVSFKLTKVQIVWIVWSIVAFVLAIIAVAQDPAENSIVFTNDIMGFTICFLFLEGTGVVAIGVAYLLGGREE